MSHIATAQNARLQVEKRPDGVTILDGWCKIGSIAYSNFYESDAETPQRITDIHVWSGDEEAIVCTDGGGNKAKALDKVDFRTWIKAEPIVGAVKKKKS